MKGRRLKGVIDGRDECMTPNKAIFVPISICALALACAFVPAGSRGQAPTAEAQAAVANSAPGSAAAVDSGASFNDLVRLVKSGADKDVLLAYIGSSPMPYHLSGEQTSYLEDLGVPAEVLKKLGADISAEAEAVSMAAEAPIFPTNVVPAAPEATPQVIVVTQIIHEADAPPTVIVQTQVVRVIESAPPAEYAPTAGSQPPAVTVAEPAQIVDTMPEVVAPPPEDLNVSYFYQSLAPYGTWVSCEGDWFWQPTVMVCNRGWRPYCHGGRWVYTDCGWAWCSDYSWGWAPFHYGRWRHHYRYGWIWHPDTIWGPAWVNWRSCEGSIGWAPLPPYAVYGAGGFTYYGSYVSPGYEFGLVQSSYCFVPTTHFCEPALPTCVLPPPQVTQIYSTTVVIPNSYSTVNGYTYNHGPPEERIAKALHRAIPRLKIVSANIRAGEPIHRNMVTKSDFVVYRPKVSPAAPESPRAAVARQQALVNKHEPARFSPTVSTYKDMNAPRTESPHVQQNRAIPPVTIVNPSPIVRSPAPSAPARVQPQQPAYSAPTSPGSKNEGLYHPQVDQHAAPPATQAPAHYWNISPPAGQSRSEAAIRVQAQQESAARLWAEESAARQQPQQVIHYQPPQQVIQQQPRQQAIQQQPRQQAIQQQPRQQVIQQQSQQQVIQRQQNSAFRDYENGANANAASRRGSSSLDKYGPGR